MEIMDCPAENWRKLTEEELRCLIEGGNSSSDWSRVTVCDGFMPGLVTRSHFSGDCRIGLRTEGTREAEGLKLPVGISNSRIHACTVGDSCAIHDVRYLSGYDIRSGCLLFNIGQLSSEEEFGAPEIEVMNENGSRRVYAFPGMRCSDAWLMAGYPEDSGMQSRLRSFSRAVKLVPLIEEGCAIANVQRIERLRCGPECTISCAVSIDTVCVCSTPEEPVRIDGNCVLRNGVIGAGNRIGGGCIAENFATGVNCTLSGGVRFFNSVLGDNSTASCCEMVCNLVFPAHEQHHNNSFLIAACVGGQSNVAAGATVGSNHNGRTADGEIKAGRGFWPGLCVSLKHSSVFASYTMLAKGSYPAELSIKLPFSLVSNNEHEGRLEIIPAFAWLYNMYALARNNSKYHSRDRRKDRSQHIEFDAFAPDSMQEAADARRLLETWAEKHCGWKPGDAFPQEIVLRGEGLEKSGRPVAILKADRAHEAYGQMLVHYAAKCLLDWLRDTGGKLPPTTGAESGKWVNFGGQPLMEADAETLRKDIREGRLDSWEDIHRRMDGLWEEYPKHKLEHAFGLLGLNPGSKDAVAAMLDKERHILKLICERAEQSRAKDFANPFRAATCRSLEETAAVFGTLEDDASLARLKKSAGDYMELIEKLKDS